MKSERGKIVLKLSLLIIFISYITPTVFFTHTHVINNVTIAHSHPYKTDQNGTPLHQHTEAQIQLIHTLSTFCSYDSIFLSFTFCLYTSGKLLLRIKPCINYTENQLESIFKLRPPPIPFA
jgi:hypothetical protein